MKAWQLITHTPSSPTYRRLRERINPARADRYSGFRRTPEVIDAWNRTAAFARALGTSIIVFQCPASFTPLKQNIDSMRAFFGRIDRKGFTFVWEPRGAWPDERTGMLSEELDLIHCVDPFRNERLFGNIDYFRLHGIKGYAYTYTERELETLRKKITRRTSSVMFNNSTMKEDALRFLDVLKA